MLRTTSSSKAPMNPIDARFRELKAQKKKALVLFIEGGDPSLEVTRQTLRYCQEAGVDVEFAWFEYAPSMEAFTAGKVDAVTIASCDALVTGAQSGKNIAILATDFSNGNDMIVAKPGIKTVKDLKGKKVGLEVGFVEHLLLLKGLEMNGMTESDVTLVNTPTHQTAQVLATPDVDAIAAWQPNSGQALKSVPGSKAVFTSADAPGLIYDFLSVSPQSLAERREARRRPRVRGARQDPDGHPSTV